MNAKYETVPMNYHCQPKDRVFIDCEMANFMQADGNQASQVIALTILTYEGKILFSKYMKPNAQIQDPGTAIHGIRLDEIMTAIPVDKIRNCIERLLKDKVIIGFAVRNDINVKKFRHQFFLLKKTKGIDENQV